MTKKTVTLVSAILFLFLLQPQLKAQPTQVEINPSTTGKLFNFYCQCHIWVYLSRFKDVIPIKSSSDYVFWQYIDIIERDTEPQLALVEIPARWN